jgi:iron complex transport system ATP-binding protein
MTARAAPAGERAAFAVDGVEFTYRGSTQPAVRNAGFSIAPGSMYAIIGPNGSGKSTLLRLLLGVLRATAGTVAYDGRGIQSWSRREIARRIGVVSQTEENTFPISVRELVAMGRYPHLGPWRRSTKDDEFAIEIAMERCAVNDLSARLVDQLSGGERQRARIARALAQEPATLVLDEPTVQLDISHEMAIFDLLSGFCRNDGKTVVIVTHNLNLAARYASAMLLLDRGVVAAEGEPRAVLTRETIEAVYGWPVRVVPHPGPGPDEGAPQIVPLTGAARPTAEKLGGDTENPID